MGSETQGVLVTEHTQGASTFHYKPPPGTAGKGHTNNPFFFEGDCKLLDAEGEWCIDPHTTVVSVWLDGCAHPSTVRMRGKTRSYVLNLTRSADEEEQLPATLILKDVVVWGGSISVPQASVTLERVRLLHPSANRYVLGEAGKTAADAVLNFNQAAGSIRAVNCTVEWSQSVVPLDKLGRGAYFSDCDFARSGYALGLSASVSDWGGSTGLTFKHNTVRLFNSFTGITPGLRATVAYNEFAFATPQEDGAGVHVHIHQQNGILLYRNWAHDLTVKAFRFDRVNRPDATWGTNGTVLENVAWRCAAACFKGDKHTIANNTIFDSSDESGQGATAALFVMMFDPTKPWAIHGENAHTHLNSNAADSIFNVSGQLPGIHVGNVGNIPIRKYLRDPDRLDFRPLPGSPLERARAGAFHSSDAELWVAGVRGAPHLRGRWVDTHPLGDDDASVDHVVSK